MADDSQRAKARATFGSSFFENSKAIPAPKNFASAQQKTANSRPIPTFKVGGAVKKADSGMPRNRPMPYDKMGAKLPRKADGGLPDVRKAAVMQRAMNETGSPITGMGAPPLKVMNKGGKAGKYADGGVSERGKAFRAAYDRGEKEFTFKNPKTGITERFTTEMAKPSAPKASAISKATPSVSVMRINIEVPNKRQQDMSSTELSNLGAQRRAGVSKGIAGKSVSDSSGFDASPMKRSSATGQTPAQMYKSMMNESKSMPKAKGNDDLYKLFVDKRGRDFNNKKQQMRMADRASAGRDLVRDANKMGSSDIGGMNHGGMAMMKPQQKNLGGALKKIAGMGLIGSLLGGKGKKGALGSLMGSKVGKLGALGLAGAMLAKKKKKQMTPAPQMNAAPAPGQIAGIGSAMMGAMAKPAPMAAAPPPRPAAPMPPQMMKQMPPMPPREPQKMTSPMPMPQRPTSPTPYEKESMNYDRPTKMTSPPPMDAPPMRSQMDSQRPTSPTANDVFKQLQSRQKMTSPAMDFDRPRTSPMPQMDAAPPAMAVGQGMAPAGAMRKGGKAGRYAVGGAGKTRLGMAPIKRAQGGKTTKSTLHPATSNKTGDRRDPEYGDYILADKNAMKKLQGSSSAPVKKAQGGAAKVRRGMMTQSGQITPGVKPHKGIRAC